MKMVYPLLLSAAVIGAALIGTGALKTEKEHLESAYNSGNCATQEPEKDTFRIAEQVSLSEIGEGDRFVIVQSNENGMRAISYVSGGWNLVGVQVRGTEEQLTFVPKQCAVFTLEDAEDGDIYLKTKKGYLSVGAGNYGLCLSEDRIVGSLWRLEDEQVLVHPAAAEETEGDSNSNSKDSESSDLYLQYTDIGRYFLADSPPEGDASEESFMRFYKLVKEYSPKEDPGGGYRLPVIETSDIHGNLVDLSGEKYAYRYAWTADKINDLRSRSGKYREDTSVLLDSGDIFQGNLLSNLLKGNPVSEVFSMMNYDAVSIGNHEFDWGIRNVIDADRTLMDYEKDGEKFKNDTPVIISNLYKDGRKVDFADDFLILDKTAVDDKGKEISVRIGVIGFAEDYSTSIMHDMFADAGYEIREDYEELAKEAEELKENGQCDAVILLTHADAPVIAQNLTPDSEIDLILGGHVHMNDIGENEQGVVYLMPQGEGKAYCYADLVFDRNEDGEAVFRDIEAETIVELQQKELYLSTENAENLDSNIVAVCDEAIEKVELILEEKIGYITVSSERYKYFPESGNRGSTAGNWYCSIMARATGADVGFYNLFGMWANVLIPDGQDRADVKVSTIYNMFPFNNRIFCFELTMEELKTLLEYALTEKGSQLFTMMMGIDCYYTDKTVNALVKDGELLYKNGEWIGEHAKDKIRVESTEYIATTDRPDEGLSNPLVQWNNTDRVVRNDCLDVEGALKVLKEEAAENDGHLSIDTHSYFICGEYEE